MNDLLLYQFLFSLRLFDAANSTELKIIIDFLSVTFVIMHHVSYIGISLKIVIHFVSVIITKTSWLIFGLIQGRLFVSELVLNTHITESSKDCADTLAKTSLELVGRHVEFDA